MKFKDSIKEVRFAGGETRIYIGNGLGLFVPHI